MLYVNVYEVGRAYGGPEEGGWWFDTGSPVAAIPVALTEDEWDRAHQQWEHERGEEPWPGDPEWSAHVDRLTRAKARKEAEQWRERYPRTGRRASVLGGEDYEVRIEQEWPEPYPKEVPHWE